MIKTIFPCFGWSNSSKMSSLPSSTSVSVRRYKPEDYHAVRTMFRDGFMESTTPYYKTKVWTRKTNALFVLLSAALPMGLCSLKDGEVWCGDYEKEGTAN